ncbi:MAG: redoxin domain-containing protein, partial [Paludibacteraceae bacterium]|nr:redoxin domain-containing protein [Paludibacteraceae bacterium]
MNIGDKIPEVLGFDQNGNEIKSSYYLGRKIILFSYPKANTSGCTAEACSLQTHKA